MTFVCGTRELLTFSLQAILSNMNRKFKAVRTDVRIARERIFQEAKSDLRAMRETWFATYDFDFLEADSISSKSIGHLSDMIELSKAYQRGAQQLELGHGQLQKANEDIADHIRETVQQRDRTCLSKTMPRSLFKKPLQETLGDLGLKLD